MRASTPASASSARCDGCHVVTVEHLRGADGTLHPVQQAMVDRHGSQCGFCTPGFVMSLYGAVDARRPTPSVAADREGAAGQSLPLHRLRADRARRRRRSRATARPRSDPLVAERERDDGAARGAARRQRGSRSARASDRLIVPAVGRRSRRRCCGRDPDGDASSPARPMSASGSPSSCATSRR